MDRIQPERITTVLKCVARENKMSNAFIQYRNISSGIKPSA